MCLFSIFSKIRINIILFIIISLKALSECVFVKNNVIKDGKVSGQEIKVQGKELLEAHPEWQEVFNAAIDKCVAEGTSKEAELKKKLSEAPYNIKDGNPLYAYIINCARVHIMQNCPSKPTPLGMNE